MSNILVYSKEGCPFCSLLKMELGKRKLSYIQYDLSDDSLRQEFYANTGKKTVPQVYLSQDEGSLTQPSGEAIGGWSDVSANWELLENKE